MTKPSRPVTKDFLLKPKTHRLDLDGGSVFIRALTAQYAISLRDKKMDNEAVFEMISMSLCDESGASLLTAEEAGQLPIATMNQIVNGILEFNGIGPDAVEKAKADLKNDQTEGSTKS